MIQEIKFNIDVPEGKRAVLKDNTIIFEDIKPQLPKTWEEFCKQNKIKDGECYLNYVSEIKEVPIRERLAGSDRIVLPNKQAAEAHLALMRLHQLRDAWREGWLPDYNNDNQDKYVILKIGNEYEVRDYKVYSFFLSFQDEKRADEFKNCFIDLIKKAGDLI